MGRTSITVSAFLDQTRLAEGEPFLLGYVTFSWKKLAQTASFVPKNFENGGRRRRGSVSRSGTTFVLGSDLGEIIPNFGSIPHCGCNCLKC